MRLRSDHRRARQGKKFSSWQTHAQRKILALDFDSISLAANDADQVANALAISTAMPHTTRDVASAILPLREAMTDTPSISFSS